ncbi:MAG: hypothetical protein ACFFAJ_04600 [Candidatus Hodarchaeota archaeon]
MVKNTRLQCQGITILLLVISTLFGFIIQINGNPLSVTVDPLSIYQVTNAPDNSVYQNDQFNLIVSITNREQIPYVENVTVYVQIPSEFEFLTSSIMDLEVENDTSEFSYDFGQLKIEQNVNFSVTYNVTSDEAKTITLESVNVTFRVLETVDDFQLSETINMLLKGPRDLTTTVSIAPIPSGTIPAHPILSVIGYLLPILAFGVSIVILRRFRH